MAEAGESIESLLGKTEDLIKMQHSLRERDSERNLRDEIRRRVHENMVQMLDLLGGNEDKKPTGARVLMKIAEIARKYLEETLQTRLMRIILKEYRRAQEVRVRKLILEKKGVEAAEVFDKQYKMLKELVRLFPTEEQLQASRDTKLSRPKSIGAGTSRKKLGARARQPKESPRQKRAQETHHMMQGTDVPRHQKSQAATRSAKTVQMKSNKRIPAVASEKAGIRRRPTTPLLPSRKLQPTKVKAKEEEDSWIGRKSADLDDEAQWERATGEKI